MTGTIRLLPNCPGSLLPQINQHARSRRHIHQSPPEPPSFCLPMIAVCCTNNLMPRRIKKKQSLLAPAGNLIKRLSNTRARSRRKAVRYGLWAVGLFLVYSAMSGTYGIPRIIRLELKRSNLVESNRELTAELIDSDRIRDMLKNDPAYIEKIARTRYHMAYPNETLYRYRGQ